MRPVTIFTGFLGAGKTTLINRLLTEPNGLRFAVIVNEFGSIGIDADLLKGNRDGIIQLSNGCLCCALLSDLTRALRALAKRTDFDYLLIETSGAADPVPVAQPFLNRTGPGAHFRLDAVVTLIDAQNFELLRKKETVLDAQAAVADFLVLTKTSTTTAESNRKLYTELLELNPKAKIELADSLEWHPKALLDTGTFDLETRLKTDAKFLDELHRRHGPELDSLTINWTGSFDPIKFEQAIQKIADMGAIYRAKGIFQLSGSKTPGILHGVNSRFEVIWGGPNHDSTANRNRMVFLGPSLDKEQITAWLEEAFNQEASA